MDPFDEVYSGHAVPRDRYLPAVDMRDPEFVGGYRIHKYDFGGGNVVTHIHANGPENAAKNGADDLFRNLQKDGSIPLKRHALNTASGEMLASHFAVNYGMPYKYSVAVDSKPFNEAPSAIFSALKHLNQAAKSAVSDEGFKDFNEMLCVGYYEKGKMGYHDDGEKELGPTVASLSLGATAFMSIRLKKRYYTGITTKGNKYDHEAPVLPGCVLEAERKALNAKWGNVTPAEFDTLQKAFYKQHSRELNRNCPELLNMTLMHGDIMVMHGSDLQKYYEHQVVSPGLTRFALTCRHIDPDLVDPAYHWKAVWDPTATITTEEQPKEAATLQRYAPDWNMFRG
ncbi:hypothetical protein MMC13_002710 [Lambiella insularis]|nr:hypothetical protein [Lambiella insularis]